MERVMYRLVITVPQTGPSAKALLTLVKKEVGASPRLRKNRVPPMRGYLVPEVVRYSIDVACTADERIQIIVKLNERGVKTWWRRHIHAHTGQRIS